MTWSKHVPKGAFIRCAFNLSETCGTTTTCDATVTNKLLKFEVQSMDIVSYLTSVLESGGTDQCVYVGCSGSGSCCATETFTSLIDIPTGSELVVGPVGNRSWSFAGLNALCPTIVFSLQPTPDVYITEPPAEDYRIELSVDANPQNFVGELRYNWQYCLLNPLEDANWADAYIAERNLLMPAFILPTITKYYFRCVASSVNHAIVASDICTVHIDFVRSPVNFDFIFETIPTNDISPPDTGPYAYVDVITATTQDLSITGSIEMGSVLKWDSEAATGSWRGWEIVPDVSLNTLRVYLCLVLESEAQYDGVLQATLENISVYTYSLNGVTIQPDSNGTYVFPGKGWTLQISGLTGRISISCTAPDDPQLPVITLHSPQAVIQNFQLYGARGVISPINLQLVDSGT